MGISPSLGHTQCENLPMSRLGTAARIGGPIMVTSFQSSIEKLSLGTLALLGRGGLDGCSAASCRSSEAATLVSAASQCFTG